MNSLRRFAWSFVAALMLTPAALFAANSATIGNLVWSYTVSSGAATITGVKPTATGDQVEGVVDVPSALGGYPVKVIGYNAFNGKTYMTGANLPSGIVELGHDCFRGCKRLSSLTLPPTVTKKVTKIEKSFAVIE